MQVDYWVVVDNHVVFLVEPFFRYEVPLKIEKYIDSYTEQQKINWKNSKKIVIYENKDQLRKFIEDAKERKNAGKKLYFGKIKKAVARRIKNVI